MAMFLHRAGLRMIDVGYKGNAPAINDVIAGHVPAMSSLFGDAWQQAKSGAIRMLAVTSEQRLPQAPDVPTLSESGFPGFQAAAWHGLLAPARTPPAIVDRLSAEVIRIVGDKKFQERLLEVGLEPVGNTPAEFARMIAADLLLWFDAVRAAGLRS
jgi:tripartite-type tricarboxylate transporter receptor subunit TctC